MDGVRLGAKSGGSGSAIANIDVMDNEEEQATGEQPMSAISGLC